MQQCTKISNFSFRFFFMLAVVAGLSLVLAGEADAMKSEGKSGWKYGAATKGIVCGDKLCSEIKETPKIMEKPQKYENLSPMEQFKTGTNLHEIKCEGGHVLVMKSSTETPACVKPNSADILLERGWALPVMLN